jgi:NAD(P)-dependent dehydrogenase (short-subunit alcohol dehydrogenase family)
MAGLLEGKVAIVTGAGRGLGRDEALLLAKHGAKVIVNDVGLGIGQASKGAETELTDTSTRPADEVVKEIKDMDGEAAPNYESVTDFEGAKRIIDQAIDNFGKLDILVNNAGILRDKMVFNMEEGEFDAVIAVHLKGTFNCTRHATNYWRAESKAGKTVAGRIINTASDAGLLYNPGQSNYGAAKAGIVAFTLIVAKEVGRYGVTANVVLPVARTRLTTEGTPSLAPMMGNKEDYEKKYGYDVLGPEMMAPLVVYLASDDAAEVTGQVIRVVGGNLWVMHSWRSGEVAKRDPPGMWEPKEIGPKIKELIAKQPEREELAGIIMGVLS